MQRVSDRIIVVKLIVGQRVVTVGEVITAKRQAFKAWKTGKGTRASYHAAKCIARCAAGFPPHFEIGGKFGLIPYFCTLNVYRGPHHF